MRNQDERWAVGPFSRQKRTKRLGLRLPPLPRTEERIERRQWGDRAEGQELGGLEAAAPAARVDRRAAQPAGAECLADGSCLPSTCRIEIALGGAVAEDETGRIARSGCNCMAERDDGAGPIEKLRAGGPRQGEAGAEQRCRTEQGPPAAH